MAQISLSHPMRVRGLKLNWYTEHLSGAGQSFPDALAGSVVAALTRSPLILVNSSLDQTTIDFVQEKKMNMNN